MSLTICFWTFLKVDQHSNFALSLSRKLQFQFKKLLFFHNENDWIALFIFIPFDHNACQLYQIGTKILMLMTILWHFYRFFGFFKSQIVKKSCCLLFPKSCTMAECKQENIFHPVMKNSICSFHRQSREKLKWWLIFKKCNEQMVSDTQKFYFCSSSRLYIMYFQNTM